MKGPQIGGIALAVLGAGVLAFFLSQGERTDPSSSGGATGATGATAAAPPPKTEPPASDATPPPAAGADAGAAPSAAAPPTRPGQLPVELSPLEGLGYRELVPEDREKLKLPEKLTGLVVTAVDPRSPAAEAKLEPGDVIAKAQTTAIASEADLKKVVSEREHTLITVYRDGRPFHVVLHRPWVEEAPPQQK